METGLESLGSVGRPLARLVPVQSQEVVQNPWEDQIREASFLPAGQSVEDQNSPEQGLQVAHLHWCLLCHLLGAPWVLLLYPTPLQRSESSLRHRFW